MENFLILVYRPAGDHEIPRDNGVWMLRILNCKSVLFNTDIKCVVVYLQTT